MPRKLTSKTPWRDKLEKSQEPRIMDVPSSWRKRYGDGRMVISTPLQVDALVRKVRKGHLVTPTILGKRLAAEAGVENACPLCTGIFLRIVAEAAEEDLAAGKSRVTPYWRVVKADGRLYDTFPGCPESQAAHLRAEGHEVTEQSGRRPPKVVDWESKLEKL